MDHKGKKAKNYRFYLHVIFWLVYTLVHTVINTAFPSSSDLVYTFPIRFLRYWLNELAMLPLILIATYGFLYYIIPTLIIPKKYVRAILIFVLGIFLLLILYRLELYYVISPLNYNEYPSYNPLEAKRLLYSSLEVLSAVGLASTVKLLRQRILSQQREQKLIQEKLQSELNYLRSQINPHFLFNTLNNIYALARRNSPDTGVVVLKLSKILRFMLYECSNPRIPIESELKVIKDYVELERLRYNDRLKITYTDDIETPQLMTAPLLLLPLVENAFKHGVSKTRFKSYVNIDVILLQGKLQFTVENNCESVIVEDTDNGIGIANVRRQLELIYPNAHQLIINNSNNIFNVYLEIDLEQHYE